MQEYMYTCKKKVFKIMLKLFKCVWERMYKGKVFECIQECKYGEKVFECMQEYMYTF